MEYLEYFKLSAEPFSNAPMSRFYYGSDQHAEALRRLQYVASSMKGLAICVGDIGHGKTTLARRMLDSLPEKEYEAAMLVIVHAGINANWLLKRIAIQLGVKDPAEHKLSILSQLYNRLLEIHAQGKKAIVLIDEAQMLATRELMEEFRGMLNLEVPEHKLITFIFFGLPEIENNLKLDPPLAQRIALRYHLKPLTVDDTAAYIYHRLRVAGGRAELMPSDLMPEIHRLTRGVPRVLNTLCDNLLLEMYFSQSVAAEASLLAEVADNLDLPEDQPTSLPVPPPTPSDEPAVPGGAGHDAIDAIERSSVSPDVDAMRELAEPIAAEVAGEPFDSPVLVDEGADAPESSGEPDAPSALGSSANQSFEPSVAPAPGSETGFDSHEIQGPTEPPDVRDPLEFIHTPSVSPVDPSRTRRLPVADAGNEPSAANDGLDELEIEVVEQGSALGFDSPSEYLPDEYLPDFEPAAAMRPPVPAPPLDTEPPVPPEPPVVPPAPPEAAVQGEQRVDAPTTEAESTRSAPLPPRIDFNEIDDLLDDISATINKK